VEIVDDRWRSWSFRYRRRVGAIGQIKAANHVRALYGDVVAGGPFTGMTFAVDAAVDECLGPKLLGEYESELSEIVERLCHAPWERIVNVGCAGGYYLVGLALRCPSATCHGFDLDPRLQECARRVASDNGVGDRVQVHGLCTPERLDELAGPGSLVVVDIEGAEESLLQPDDMPALAGSTLLIELHDFAARQVSSTLMARFRGTHDATVVVAVEKPWSSHPAAAAVPRPYRRWALDERRPAGMRWVLFEPQIERSHGTGAPRRSAAAMREPALVSIPGTGSSSGADGGRDVAGGRHRSAPRREES
jgi:hypothetical protein